MPQAIVGGTTITSATKLWNTAPKSIQAHRTRVNGHTPGEERSAPAQPTALRFINTVLHFKTGGAPEFTDITDRVTEVVRETGIADGQVLIFSRHTTAAVRIQEAEPLLMEDLKSCLERLAPRDIPYRHNDFEVRTVNMTSDESPNGHSHCRHLFLGASETLPLVAGALALGTWQRLFLIELDRPRRREVHIQILGY